MNTDVILDLAKEKSDYRLARVIRVFPGFTSAQVQFDEEDTPSEKNTDF